MRRVLFVCVENSCRSQMAEGFARKLGAGRIEANSAGSRPSGKVNPLAIELMKEVGYDLAGHRSKGLVDVSDEEFDLIVGMGCGDDCLSIRAKKREEWAIPCPKGLPAEEFRAIRDLIKSKVKELLLQ